MTSKEKHARPDNGAEPLHRTRLEPISDEPLAPWRKALTIETCDLYWMPVDHTPLPWRQRTWCLQFLKLLGEHLGRLQLEPNLFLQMKGLHPDLMDPFLRHAVRFAPVMGLSRRRGASLPKLPDEEYAEKLKNGEVVYDHKAIQPDYCYWFLKPETEAQTDLFFGFGGLTVLFLPPGEQNPIQLPPIPPGVANHPVFKPLLADNRIEKLASSMMRIQSPFFPKSKALFGRGLENELQYPGLKFIVPLFTSKDFFDASPSEIEGWFTLFDVAIAESPADKGLLLAAKREIRMDSILRDIGNRLRENNRVSSSAHDHAAFGN
jgi:hypothetical protein